MVSPKGHPFALSLSSWDAGFGYFLYSRSKLLNKIFQVLVDCHLCALGLITFSDHFSIGFTESSRPHILGSRVYIQIQGSYDSEVITNGILHCSPFGYVKT
ncbi:hypothetical protein TNIN_95281 [Trichonephila inaurata madagascariensis]|uniref:Uncharacterized protein n=1 Tax=Trichonephila inaurata madagascariensis TaxID=2747483 RepID=A0A8X6YUQ8_9ARAC|nr:hypothetical protein TNIN_95281 [Trichonephila inaurata madagascariensis]